MFDAAGAALSQVYTVVVCVLAYYDILLWYILVF